MEYTTTRIIDAETKETPAFQRADGLIVQISPFCKIRSIMIVYPIKRSEGVEFTVTLGSHCTLDHPVQIIFSSEVHKFVELGAFTHTRRPTVLVAPFGCQFNTGLGTDSSEDTVVSVGPVQAGNDVRAIWEWRNCLDIPTRVIHDIVYAHLLKKDKDIPTMYALQALPGYVEKMIAAMEPATAETFLDLCLGKFYDAPSDINEHLPTLVGLASECDSVLELGTRGGVSFMAFLGGLAGSKPIPGPTYFPPGYSSAPHRPMEEYTREWDAMLERAPRTTLPLGTKRLIGVDLEDYSQDLGISSTLAIGKILGIDTTFVEANDLEYEPPQVDMCFIDTLHCYTQLRDELERYAPKVNKYIVMHDTTVDGVESEFVRLGTTYEADGFLTIDALCEANAHWTREDCLKGLWFAVEEFLEKHSDEWTLKFRHTNNNGLTCLERIAKTE